MARKQWGLILFFAFCFGSSLLNWGTCEAAEPYVIGYIADITGMARANYAPECEGTRLYIDLLNSQGGINGHPVKLVIEDGKSDPALSAAVAKKLIVEDNALALMGLGFSRAQPPVMEMASKEKVPVIAGYTLIMDVHKAQPGDVGFATGYIMHPKFHPGGYGFAKVAATLHPKGRMASSGYDTPGGRVWSQWASEWAKKMGLEVVYHEDIPPQSVDLMPWASKVAKEDPDIYTNAEGGEIFISLAVALEKSGWTKDLLFPDFVTEADLVKGIERLMTKASWVMWFGRYASAYEKIPEYARIGEAMKKFGHQYPLSARHAQGWTMGRLIEQALTKAGWPCTREKLLSALETTDLDTKGLSGGPIRFTATDHYGPTWWKVYRWNPKQRALEPVMDWFRIDAEKIAKE